jgi:hypothetical protein
MDAILQRRREGTRRLRRIAWSSPFDKRYPRHPQPTCQLIGATICCPVAYWICPLRQEDGSRGPCWPARSRRHGAYGGLREPLRDENEGSAENCPTDCDGEDHLFLLPPLPSIQQFPCASAVRSEYPIDRCACLAMSEGRSPAPSVRAPVRPLSTAADPCRRQLLSP